MISATSPTQSSWVRRECKGLTFLQSAALLDIEIDHAFTTRTGGCSRSPYETLNLGSHVGDHMVDVLENRRRVIAALEMPSSSIVTAGQVHGAEVRVVDGNKTFYPDTDALITNQSDLLLMLMFADCVPIIVADPQNQAIGVVHSGWKGTSQNIIKNVISAMTQNYGTNPAACTAVIGPCISMENYEVSAEVADIFTTDFADGIPVNTALIRSRNRNTGSCLLNLRLAVRDQLILAGFRIESIVVSDDCTYANSQDFFSHRRDSAVGKPTGRMAAVVGIQSKARSRRLV